MGGENEIPVQPGGELNALQAGAEQEAVGATRRDWRGAQVLFPCGIGERQPVIQLGEAIGKSPLLRRINPLLQRPRCQRQAARRFSDAKIDAARRYRGQQVEVFRHFVRAVVLQHDAAGSDANLPGLAEDPGNHHFRRRAG